MDTRVAVASVGKQFVAAAILLLVERGELAPDDPVRRWFGQGAGWWRAVTVEHLLTATSGLGHGSDVEPGATAATRRATTVPYR